MADPFERLASELTSPARGAKAVTPSDADDLPDGACRALYVGGAGNVSVVTLDGDEVTFVGVAAGTALPVRLTAVKSTGTTATSLLALY